MGKSYEFEPVAVKTIRTANRRISGKIPVPQSRALIEEMRKYEPRSMQGQPLVVWDRAKGVHVWDKYGNQWLDFSSGVLVANAGHGRREIVDAVVRAARKPLLHSYCFANQARADLVKKLVEIAPSNFNKCFLLTTGSESTECAIKLCRSHGHWIGGKTKNVLVTFDGSFHGRTMGSQMAGGIPSLKSWIINSDVDMVNVPYPDDFRCKDTSFSLFEKTLRKLKVNPRRVCGVMTETFQGGSATFIPKDYMRKLRAWCDRNQVLLVFDEVQASMGRTGKMFAFQHFGVRADLVCLGKGLSSGLPISAVLGNGKVLDLYEPGSMTSTHTGNPICSASALANINLLVKEKLVENASGLGKILYPWIKALGKRYSANVGMADAVGLVGAVQMVKPGTMEPDNLTAFEIIRRCVEKGLMLFGPVGMGGGSVKICPPLCITKAQFLEGLDVLEQAFADVLG